MDKKVTKTFPMNLAITSHQRSSDQLGFVRLCLRATAQRTRFFLIRLGTVVEFTFSMIFHSVQHSVNMQNSCLLLSR